MEWIEWLGSACQDKSVLARLDRFTLYDHNYVSTLDEQEKTFSCLLNCKRINRVLNSVCQIEGDLKVGQINISCWLLDEQHVVRGEWQHQRIELTRFAFRYNEQSNQNMFIRTDPLTGQIAVTLSFFTGQGILEDDHRFRETMTDLCHLVGEESERIFNTMLEIIFGREANEPYLKSGVKVNPGFPRYMKLVKLLDKIKSLIATSNFYKIRSDISTAHKNRSYFKKVYLNQEKKLIYNPRVTQMAFLYEPKFSKRYEEISKKPKDLAGHFIKDYIELEEKNEIEFAKHLNEGYEKHLLLPAIDIEPFTDMSQVELVYGERVVKATVVKMSKEEHRHELNILKAIGKKHPNMAQHLLPSNLPEEASHWMLYAFEEELPLLEFLRRNGHTVSLATKLHLMVQICSFVQYLHNKRVAYFVQLENIFVSKALEIKIRGLYRSYRVKEWSEGNKETEGISDVHDLLMGKEEMVEFPYRFVKAGDRDNEKCDVMSLGVCLYRVLMDKFPFLDRVAGRTEQLWNKENWLRMWTVETEYFLIKGGELGKIMAHLMLKCMELENIANRPYVDWLLVILSEMKTSLNGLY